CLVTNATGPVTTYSFEVLDANTIGGGLTCASNLVSVDGWTGTLSAHHPGGIDVCTVTAPTTVSWQTYWNLLLTADPYIGGPTLATFHNDGDCDLDDFVLGIPVGCDVKIDSATGSAGLFTPGAPVGFSSNNDPLPSLPEPGTLALLLIGMTGLPLIRRKFAR
ncbi:MAG TPA: PEP-CTERM sorting domain-containing protein, partial [Candidatus Limnocylindria bacterium]|nr:PEP-CTERM sorting domain-containing protein [Candidatus Limnocylindria bacterium]